MIGEIKINISLEYIDLYKEYRLVYHGCEKRNEVD